MVKQVDTSKLDRIREAAMEIIGQCGIQNSSVASIALRAGVSVGYLYRHYPGKEDLINDLVEEALSIVTDRIYALAAQTHDIRAVVRGVVEFLLEDAEVHPARYKFLIMLLNDFSLAVNPQIRERIRSIGSELIGIGRENCTLEEDISIEDLYIALVGIPMQYLSMEYKFSFNEETQTSPRRIQRIVSASLSMIRRRYSEESTHSLLAIERSEDPSDGRD